MKMRNAFFRNVFYACISVLTVIGLICGIAVSAHGKSDIDGRQMDEYLDEKAGEYRVRIRKCLDDEAFENAGITMTYVTDHRSETRTYTVLLHHRKFASLTQCEKEDLEAQIGDMAFEEKGCEFEIILD